MTSSAARDISYSYSARSKPGRAMIRLMENATGRLSLIKRAAGYQDEVAQGRDFWEVMVDRYGLSLDVVGGSLDNIPRTGPLIVIANHPYGILDGLILGYILKSRRDDFRILANAVFTRAEALKHIVLPISFDEGSDTRKLNSRSIRSALRHLQNGGSLGAFPGGTVATRRSLRTVAAEPHWPTTVSRLAVSSEAKCLPIYFHGSNSFLFHLLSHVHDTLRLASYIREFKVRTDTKVCVSIGKPIKHDDFEYGSLAEHAWFLRKCVANLGEVDESIIGKQYL